MPKPSRTTEQKKRRVGKDVFFGLRIERETSEFLDGVASDAGTSKSGAARGLIEGARSLVTDENCVLAVEGKNIVPRRVDEGRKKAAGKKRR